MNNTTATKIATWKDLRVFNARRFAARSVDWEAEAKVWAAETQRWVEHG